MLFNMDIQHKHLLSICLIYVSVLVVIADHIQTRLRSGQSNNVRDGYDPYLPTTLTRRDWSRRHIREWAMHQRYHQLVADRINAVRKQGQPNSRDQKVNVRPSIQPRQPILTGFPQRRVHSENLSKPIVTDLAEKVIAVPVPVLIHSQVDSKPTIVSSQNTGAITLLNKSHTVTGHRAGFDGNGHVQSDSYLTDKNTPQAVATNTVRAFGNVNIHNVTPTIVVDLSNRNNFTSMTRTKTGGESLLHLFNDRQPAINNKADETKLKHHLLAISEMQTRTGLDPTNQRLIRMQLEYIDTIKGSTIKREVLKLVVKDIVEKSGVLIRSKHTSTDITEMTSLLSLIKSISGRRTTTPIPIDVQPQSGSISSKISAGLDMTRYQHSNKLPEQHQGVNLDHLVGLSIYGDRRSINKGKTSDWTKVSITTIPSTTRFQPKIEPMGGTDEYWTHLSAGFQDMICALCRKRNSESCINRYCQNDEPAP